MTGTWCGFAAYGVQASVPLDQRRRTEHTLACARIFIAITALAALALSRTSSPGQYNHISYALLGAYLVLAIATLVVLRFRPQLRTVSAPAMHLVDVSVAAAVTLFTGGTDGPFFVLFLFTLLAAAYRWGFVETVATACAGVVFLLVEAAVGPVVHGLFGEGQYDPDRLIMRSTYLLLAGVLTGYFAQSEKQFRSEHIAIGAIVGLADVRAGLRKTMAAVFDAVLRLFDAQRLLLVVHEKRSNQVFLWEAGRSNEGSAQVIRSQRLESACLPTYMFAPAAAAWHAVRRGARGERFDVVALDREGSRLNGSTFSAEPWAFPPEFLASIAAFDQSSAAFDQLMAVGVDLGKEWTGRLFLIDPRVGTDRSGALGFCQRVVRQISPAVHNVYLLHRLRSAAGAIERGRLRRELHDGVIQTVTGIEMQITALSHRVAAESPRVANELGRFRQLLRQEVGCLRELMQQLRPVDLTPEQLVDTMAESVERFQQETGIVARFITQLDRVALPPRACREVAQILREALVNVRRHSGARNVSVRLATVNRDCRLSIDDDGCGFPFAGRLSHADIEAGRQGPLVIEERVRLIGGELTIESDPGQGAHLEIAVPLSAYANHR